MRLREKGLLAALLAVAVAFGAAPATAAPVGSVPARQALAPGDIDEGGTKKLRDQLDAATKGYVDAKAALDNSTTRQKELDARLKTIGEELTVRSQAVGELASRAYRTGRIGPIAALLNTSSPEGFLDRTTALGNLATSEDRQLRLLQETQELQTRARAAIDNEIREQKKQLATMEQRKKQAERALAEAGSGQSSSGVQGSGSGSGSGSASAKPAPRNANGSWPSEGCTINDPTTSGCITPRTLHALNQAKAAGFTRYVSCYRSGGSGEHPKGRACDFAAQKGGFGGVATGGDRTYGNNLAAYYVNNASRLGVLYVIWFKQIWLPGSGWKAYRGGGDPSSDHTNHVHLSVY
ncbi:coiled-coil domain-containing protein [Polymorphospora lycopeni]|uniref:coiled-coil domain-containing protein n=1 Tax=Polymorphospora TaxID=338583 RepID=UPI0035D4FD62